MRRLIAASGIIAVLISPPSLSGETAYACPYIAEEVKQQQADLIVVGTVTDVEQRSVELDVSRYLKREGPESLQVTWLADGVGTASQQLGETLVVYLHQEADGSLSTSGCRNETLRGGTFVTIQGEDNPIGTSLQQEDSAQDQDHGDEATKDTPWLIVLPLAFAIPLAFLLIPASLSKRTPGH